MQKRTPDFENNLLRVLKKEKPQRATLFEMFMNNDIYTYLAGHGAPEEGIFGNMRLAVDAMAAAGYDYATCFFTDYSLRADERQKADTVSLNGSGLITDWESFEKYEWPDIETCDYSPLEKIKPYLPDGMKIMVMAPDGILENVINLVGYDNLCIMLFEEPELVQEIFNNVGERMIKYYQNAASIDTVGLICSNDDWGFNTQTFLSPDDMRKYVFPWHKKIIDIAHSNNKPCILHSCGYFNEVIDDLIDLGFDARHSYEDNITPVEDAYEQLQGRITVLGGIDLNFLCTSTPEKIYARSRAMLERTAERGGYALGSGNSIPRYVPKENFLAMTRAALEFDA